MSESFNTIVVGLGAMGASTLYQLALRHTKVLGMDRFSPPHTLGSTHGDTRITRKGIGEGVQYSPLSLRSYEIFADIEKKTKTQLLQITGGVVISSDPDGTARNTEAFFRNTVDAAVKYGIKHDVMDAKEMRKRFPQFNVDDDEVTYYEYDAGILRPEKCVHAQLELARELGAQVHTNERLLSFSESQNVITVKTDLNTYTCEKLVLSVGPWLPQDVCDRDDFNSVFKVYREVLYWFDISRIYERFTPPTCPIFIWEPKNKNGMYGFPAVDGKEGGFKIAFEQYEISCNPESVEREVSPAETKEMFKNYVSPHFPGAGSQCVKSAVCLYTVTPDGAFVIDWLPGSKNILICSPCSGHGFKHSAAIGECICNLLCDGESKIDLSSFKLERFKEAARK